MGVVYRAHDGETGRVVALKLMLPEIASNRRFRQRFVLEAEVGPKLDHAHIVPVFDLGESDGELFIVMRLVEGIDLGAVLEEGGPIEAHRALRSVRQASAALDYAHEHGVVHRDVKPQNLLVRSLEEGQDHLYLTDFGLVRPTSAESTASRTSDVFGSIQYISPEHIEGLPTDGRADVYSLACVLYECLTGKPPFERSNEVAVLWAHVHEDPSSRDRDRSCSTWGGGSGDPPGDVQAPRRPLPHLRRVCRRPRKGPATTSQYTCAADDGESTCPAGSPVSDLNWLTSGDGSRAELVITIRAERNGAVLQKRTLTVPYAGQPTGFLP